MALHPFLVALLGGLLIGASSAAFLLFEGRIAGISGMLAGLVSVRTSARGVRAAFLLGLALVGLVAARVAPGAIGAPPLDATWALAGAGVLVGVGTRLGGGCTSGHGVCGIGRLSRRSVVATLTFMATGALAVFALRALGVTS